MIYKTDGHQLMTIRFVLSDPKFQRLCRHTRRELQAFNYLFRRQDKYKPASQPHARIKDALSADIYFSFIQLRMQIIHGGFVGVACFVKDDPLIMTVLYGVGSLVLVFNFHAKYMLFVDGLF